MSDAQPATTSDQQPAASRSEAKIPLLRDDQHRGVFARLFREGYLFDFFQAVRLLEMLFPPERKSLTHAEFFDEPVRLRPHSGLAFPATDVHKVERLAGEPARVRLTATFMGLYGVDSPLPVYFYKEIATESERSQTLRDFLDMFNHRLYSLFYRSWKKYRPALHHLPNSEDEYSQRVLCLAGLGTKNVASHPQISPLRLAAFAGRLSCRARNAEGLRNLVADFFPGIRVAVLENVPRWWHIPERPRMGQTGSVRFALGEMACVGQKVFDIAGKFRIVLGPLTLAQYLTFLPKGANASMLHYLVRLYAPDHLDFDVELILKTAEIPPLRLGDKGMQMGLTTWSGRPQGEMTSRVVAYEGGGKGTEG